MIGLIAIAGVSIAMIMTLLRLFSGPSLYDRALAATLVLIELALIAAGVAVFIGEVVIVDVALALVFVAIVAAVAVLKFFRARTFQPALVRAGEDS